MLGLFIVCEYRPLSHCPSLDMPPTILQPCICWKIFITKDSLPNFASQISAEKNG